MLRPIIKYRENELRFIGIVIFFCLGNAYGDAFEDSYKLTQQNRDKFKLGRIFFFDKIMSGNKNISCATCHNPLLFTGDALSLPVGEGGKGLGPTRDTGSIVKLGAIFCFSKEQLIEDIGNIPTFV